MKAQFQNKPKPVECRVIWRMDPYIRPVGKDKALIMQRICFLYNGEKHYTDVVLENVKKENAVTRFRAMYTRTQNARKNGTLGVYKMEVAS